MINVNTIVKKTATTIEDGIKNLLDGAKEDYLSWTNHGGTKELNDINRKMITEFNEGFRVNHGSKYVKIMQNNGGSAWGFIVKKYGGKFRAGDLLMCAGYNKPATNAARGNVLDGNYAIRWTGPLYLK